MNKTLLTFLLILGFYQSTNAQVGIGTTSPEASAILDLKSNSKALLVPRLDNTGLVTTPINGMIIYDKSCECFKGFEDGAWEKMTGSSSSATVVNDCSVNGFEGTYLSGTPLDASHKFTITITNNSFVTLTVPLNTSDLQLTGTGVGSGGSMVTVSSTTPSSTFGLTLSPGTSSVIEYHLTGTPVAGTIEAEWNKFALSCSEEQIVANGFANFASPESNTYVFSANDASVSVDVQGVFVSGTTMNVDYTSGIGTYDAYTSPQISIPAIYCEDGANDWTFEYGYVSGSFLTDGSIPVTLKTYKGGVETNWLAKRVDDISTINYNVVSIPLVVNNMTLTNTIGLDEGGDAIRGALAVAGCGSCVNYDAASNNDWIQITEAEYNQMAGSITNNFVGGTKEANFNDNTGLGSAYGVSGFQYVMQRINNTATFEVPVNHYIYAFKLQYYNSTVSNVINIKLMTGTETSGNLTPVGNTVPSHNITNQVGYYVIKRNATTTPEAVSLGIHSPNIAIAAATSSLAKRGWNATGLTNSQYPNGILLQSLSSDLKQW